MGLRQVGCGLGIMTFHLLHAIIHLREIVYSQDITIFALWSPVLVQTTMDW